MPDSHMKMTVMLVVTFSGRNFRLWSDLGCSERKAIIFNP